MFDLEELDWTYGALVILFTFSIALAIAVTDSKNSSEGAGMQGTTIPATEKGSFDIECVKDSVGNRTTFSIEKTWAISVETGKREKVEYLTVDKTDVSNQTFKDLYSCLEPE